MTRRIFCTIALGMVAGCISLEERLASQDPAVRAEAVNAIDKDEQSDILVGLIGEYVVADKSVRPRYDTDVRIAAYDKLVGNADKRNQALGKFLLKKGDPFVMLGRDVYISEWSYNRWTLHSRCESDAQRALANSTEKEIAEQLIGNWHCPTLRSMLWNRLRSKQERCNVAADRLFETTHAGGTFCFDREIFNVLVDPKNEEYVTKSFTEQSRWRNFMKKGGRHDATELWCLAGRIDDYRYRGFDIDESRLKLSSVIESLLKLQCFRRQIPSTIEHLWYYLDGYEYCGFGKPDYKESKNRPYFTRFVKWILPLMNENEIKSFLAELGQKDYSERMKYDILCRVDWSRNGDSALQILNSMNDGRELLTFLTDEVAIKKCPDDMWMAKACELETAHFEDRDAISEFFARIVKTSTGDRPLPVKSTFALSCLLQYGEWIPEYKGRLLNVLSDEQLEQFALRNDFDDAAIARMKSHVRILAIMTRISDLKSRSARFGKLVSLTTGEKKEFLIASKQALDAEIKRIEDEKAAQLEKERRLAEERARKAEEERQRREAEEDATYERELAQAKGKTLVIKGYFLGMDANVARRKWAKELGGNAEIRSIGNKVTEFRFSKADLGVLLGYGNLYPEEFCKRLLEDFNLPSFDSRVVRESCEELFKRADMLNASYYDIAPRNYISQQIYTHASKNGFRVTYYTDDISFFGHKTMPGQKDIDADYSAAMTRAWGMSNAGILQAGKEHGVRKRLIEEMERACIRFMEEKGASPGTLVIQQL